MKNMDHKLKIYFINKNINTVVMKIWFEASLIRLAAWILDRNVKRSMQISRRDNNKIFEMERQLKSIANRMINKYQNL